MVAYARYLACLVSTFVLLSLLIAVTNYTVDPAGIFNAVSIKGFNSIKAKRSKYRLLWKAAHIEAEKPPIVFLGNSRVEVGINLDSAVAQRVLPPQVPVFNGAVYASMMYGVMRYMQHTMATGAGGQQVIVGIDYLMFRSTEKQREVTSYQPFEPIFATDAAGAPQSLHRLELWSRSLFELDALNASFQTLQKQAADDASESDSGQSLNSKLDERILTRSGPRNFFLKEDNAWIDGYTDIGRISYSYDSGMQYLATIIDLARTHNTQLTLFITPSHADIQYLESELDPERHLDQWKKALATAVALNNAQHPAQPPIDVWDFSLVNDVLAEPVPDEKNNKLMQWYVDPSHFREALGDLVLQVLFTGQPTQTPGGEQFGYRLTLDNVDEINRLHHESIVRWQQRQPADYASFMARIAERRAMRATAAVPAAQSD